MLYIVYGYTNELGKCENIYKNNKPQNQSSISSLSSWQGNGIRERHTGEFDCFCQFLFTKLSGSYKCAITKNKNKKYYMELTVVPKMKISIVRKLSTS